VDKDFPKQLDLPWVCPTVSGNSTTFLGYPAQKTYVSNQLANLMSVSVSTPALLFVSA